METLRDLLVQRAARLQERPAITAPGWGTLSWTGWRARVEGVAFALLAEAPPPEPPEAVHARTGTPWDWACEVAAACCGLRWDPAAAAVDAVLLGRPSIPADAGREPYHDRERIVTADTPFLPGLSHGELLARLRRRNDALGWDHETAVALPITGLHLPTVRAALWSALYAGAQVRLQEDPAGRWNPGPFLELANLLGPSLAIDPPDSDPPSAP